MGEGRGQAKCVQGGGGERVGSVSRLRTNPKKKMFLDNKISQLFFFCTKEAITLPFVIVFRKV